jgi:hypothetical protein
MPSAAGPIASAKQNLVFAIDTHDMPNGATSLGCGGFNGSTQGVKDLISGNLYTFENGMKLTNRTYYTAAGISYPEGNYGADIAGANGLYLGYNVRGGTNVYGASRSLHLWVWNNQTNSWISGYFNGARLGGHCYDNYAGAENGWQNEMAKFVADYNTVKNLFPDCTYIIVGSHACQSFRQEDIDTLISLGAPSYIQGWTDNASWREFVLVGKPGLGAGNAYGWAHENYPVDTSAVAHLNFGLPIKAAGGMEFDGTNDYVNLATNFQSGFTQASYEFVCKPTSLPSATYHQLYIQEASTWIALYNYGGITFFGIDLNNGSGWFDNNGGYNTGARTTATLTANQYYHVVYSWNGASVNVYLNGTLQATASTLQAANGRQNVTTLGAGTTSRNIGSRYSGAGNNWVGSIDVVKFYNTALTTSEVQQNYQQYKTRFNLS